MNSDETIDGQPGGGTRRLVVISAGTSDPSSSRMLADRVAQKTLDQLHGEGLGATVSTIELGPLVGPIGRALVTGFPQDELTDAIRQLAEADGVIAATPVYNAGMSGLFTSFVNVLDNDLLIAKPVVLVATAGSARHALVIDDQMRPLFAYMRAMATPTSVFGAPEDWADKALSERVGRAATELTVLVSARIAERITDAAWGTYQHSFGSRARPSGPSDEELSIDLGTDLMRLATGGSSRNDG